MIVSVLCFGKTLQETVLRLNTQRKREFKNTSLENEAKGSTGIGFTSDGGSRGAFPNRTSFDTFLEELEGWDYIVSEEVEYDEV